VLPAVLRRLSDPDAGSKIRLNNYKTQGKEHEMDRRQFLQGSLLAAAVLQGCSSVESGMSSAGSAMGLTNSLTSQLGVSPKQAAGGVGSIMNYAQSRLSPSDFGTISKAMPGVDSYMKTADEALGGSNITSMAGLDSAFSKLGMNPDMVGKFVPIVSNYVGEYGGGAAKSLLAGLF
jgi:Protein of unknown function VcgC/VcgE (DUF2780)